MGWESRPVIFLLRRDGIFLFKTSKKCISGGSLIKTLMEVVQNIPRTMCVAELKILLMILSTAALFLEKAHIALPNRMREQRMLIIRFLDCQNPMPLYEHWEILNN
jgi:hypothetical protein